MNEDKTFNIAQVVASTGNGGLERHACDLASGLVAQGHQVSFLTTSAVAPRVPKGVRPVILSLDGNRRNPLVLLELIRTLRAGKFDIIHAQGSKAAQMLALILPFLPNACATVGTLHNQKKNVRAFRKLDWAIGVSKALSKDIGSDRVTTIYHGLPSFREVNPHEDLTSQGHPHFLAIGRLVEAKGFDRLIEAWASIDANLYIIGEGPLKGELEDMIRTHALADRVKLLGRSEHVPNYLKAADGVIVSSRREGFSYVVAEALLCNCPVLSTDVPVANEVLDPDLILSHDINVMREQIVRWIADIDAWKAKCESAFETASQEFTFDHMITKTVDLYRTLLKTQTIMRSQG